jgi:hypothetical protein
VAIVAVAATGLGLFGAGVQGLTEIDGQLAGAAKRPATRDVKQVEARDDCPWKDRRDERRL